jgi:ribA/ribD-fused uncharacterized protein
MYAVILLHVGTNDVERFTLSKSQVALELLIAHVRSIAPQAKIIVSTILPRPKDFRKTQDHVNALNQWMIREIPRLFEGVIVLKSFTSFLHQKQPIQKLFYKDGLHLDTEGVQVLKQRFECVIERVRGNTVFLPTVRTLVGPFKLVRQMGEGITEVRTVDININTPFIVQGHHNPCSNFWMSSFVSRGVQVSSAEHAYQAAKAAYHGNRVAFVRIMQANSSSNAKQRGTPVHKFCKDSCQWDSMRVDIIVDIVRAKMAQCSECREWLLHSGNRRIIHTVPDIFWGVNDAGGGANVFGEILTQVRLELRRDQ